ncbi:MAG: hypothetical protein WCS48_05015, partial [Candidatus Izemoplasmatales bacterium]
EPNELPDCSTPRYELFRFALFNNNKPTVYCQEKKRIFVGYGQSLSKPAFFPTDQIIITFVIFPSKR